MRFSLEEISPDVPVANPGLLYPVPPEKNNSWISKHHLSCAFFAPFRFIHSIFKVSSHSNLEAQHSQMDDLREREVSF